MARSSWNLWLRYRLWLRHHFGLFTCDGCGNRRFMAYLNIAADAVPPPRSGREERYCANCWQKALDAIFK